MRRTQQAIAIGLNERIPIAAPDHLDDVPSRAAENRFQFLNDLAVAAHRAVEALQIAVDDENQVVEPFARSQRDRAERFRFVHFAVAQERPDFAAGRGLQPAIFEIFDEARVIDRLNRAESHRDGRKFPEVGHEPGMRIGRESAARLQLAAEIFQFLFGDAAFEVSAGVDSGSGVSLKIDNIAVAGFGGCVKKVIERHFVERGRGRKCGNMSADAFLNLVGADHHGHGIPAHQALDAALHFLAAGKWRLLPRRDRILVGSGRRERQVDPEPRRRACSASCCKSRPARSGPPRDST